MYLFELSRRPWEARTEEERKKLEKYEAIIKACLAQQLSVEAAIALKK